MLPLLTLLSLAGCDADTDDTGPDPVDHSGIVSRNDGWLRGDLHTHTTYDGGSEDVATVVALAEYLASDDFVAAHPEYVGNQLDYLSITDHRTVEQQSDPGYASDALVLVGGQEFGSDGHAGNHGIHTWVDHDPDGGGTSLAELVDAIDAVHDQGGTFSPNHPFLPSIAWPWDTRTHDGVEIWNAGWALMAPDTTTADVDAWEIEHGIAASPMYRRAVRETGSGSAFQALAWYEAQLMRGIHLAVIGGSDRHAVLLPGFPTTYVQATSATESGVVQGLSDRHTFISRNPAAAQVQVTVTVDGQSWAMGDEVVIAADTPVTVSVRVGRADGGLLRLIGGGAVDSDEALAGAELGAVWFEQVLDTRDVTLETTLTLSPGDWFYPTVFEPLLPPGVTTEQADDVQRLAVAAAGTAEEDFTALASLVIEFVDNDVLWNGSYCDPATWEDDRLQCFPADDEGLGSFFVPDLLDRALNAVTQDGVMTEWCMGAVGSAVRFVGSEG